MGAENFIQDKCTSPSPRHFFFFAFRGHDTIVGKISLLSQTGSGFQFCSLLFGKTWAIDLTLCVSISSSVEWDLHVL